jgi:DNA polymerase epsilon subunit 2
MRSSNDKFNCDLRLAADSSRICLVASRVTKPLYASYQTPCQSQQVTYLQSSLSKILFSRNSNAMLNEHPKAPQARVAPFFQPAVTPGPKNPIPSSSPAFGTPVHPIRLQPQPKATILPILLPPATLRPLAFRIFTKKHNFTLNSTALQALATFIGKYCGSGWREEGLAEKVLEEAAKIWKRNGGGLIIDGDGKEFKDILKSLEGLMVGGKVVQPGGLSRQSSFAVSISGSENGLVIGNGRPADISREDSQTSLGMSSLDVEDDEEQLSRQKDPRQWFRVVAAFEQPRLIYNINKKHFEKPAKPASLFPDPSQKTQLFRNRYNLIHQRLLRNESFQTPTVAVSRVPALHRSDSTLATRQQSYKLTPIANLLGRTGSNHLLLGLLIIAPTGTLAISDLTGSIALDLHQARPIPENGAWFAPGMIVLVDGIYEEEGLVNPSGLGGAGGVGGTIGGKFIGLSIGGPPCERREVTLGVGSANGEGDHTAGGGFGWTDFLGVGSERAAGSRMRKLEKIIFARKDLSDPAQPRTKMIILGEVQLDNPRSVEALKKVLGLYAAGPEEEMPLTVVLVGNFVQHAVMAGGSSGGSIEYKEYFDSLASALSDYPSVLQATTFVFVPGDNDPWASAFSAGAATLIPRQGIPELFTSRVKRAFTTANADAEKSLGAKTDGEAIWTSNPTRLTLFGPAQEIAIFRDDMTGRLRRSAITFSSPSEDIPVPPQNGDSQIDEDPEELMEIDQDVAAAESHVPAPKVQDAANQPVADDLQAARKLVKTILDQGHLSPFPITSRPLLWDYAGALQLYPLPSALVLVDPEAPPFNVTYEGCHVMNPGRLVAEGRRGVARWTEYDAFTRRGKSREVMF